jgi:hypothetical protein
MFESLRQRFLNHERHRKNEDDENEKTTFTRSLKMSNDQLNYGFFADLIFLFVIFNRQIYVLFFKRLRRNHVDVIRRFKRGKLSTCFLLLLVGNKQWPLNISLHDYLFQRI